MIRQVDVTELKQVLDSNPDALLVDVREINEYREVHAPRAKLMPMSSFSPEQFSLTFPVDKAEEIFLICHSGGRSLRIAQMLEQAGYQNLVNVMGGTSAWVMSGFELKHGE